MDTGFGGWENFVVVLLQMIDAKQKVVPPPTDYVPHSENGFQLPATRQHMSSENPSYLNLECREGEL